MTLLYNQYRLAALSRYREMFQDMQMAHQPTMGAYGRGLWIERR